MSNQIPAKAFTGTLAEDGENEEPLKGLVNHGPPMENRMVTVVGEERKSEFPGPLYECVSWLEMFFNDAGSIVDIPLPPLHTSIKPDSFVAKVLHTLPEWVPPGKTISYRDLAAEMGNPRAARAVGMAMAVNPVPLLLPCHRVIKSDGTLRKYIAGLPVKRWLLEHEGAKLG
ncbi:Methylated-DNA--protein-cysteine methyltransferase [Holothuria leucospilota]|uniref:Methylated-DNA--protein-cysteine methyltransferase n=1 Tax=Holothuria leucospilota TaxID=206669 RepID=A0A9Q1BI42_HOLLE|nr:Methylated-DNA--protein-cysteine methyltransferase [Holothuria leucospilota]